MLNTIVAESLRQFADILEKSDDVKADAMTLIKDTYIKHRRIVFNGNNYSEEWLRIAEERGLLNLRTTVDALPYFTAEKNLKLFRQHKIFTETEVEARQAIFYEEYSKIINIEALTLLDMVNKDIVPAVSAYIRQLSETVSIKKSITSELPCETEMSLISSLSSNCDEMFRKARELETALATVDDILTDEASARFFCDTVIPLMTEIRILADELETNTAAEFWPMPSYGALLFS